MQFLKAIPLIALAGEFLWTYHHQRHSLNPDGIIPASAIEWEAEDTRGGFDPSCVVMDWYDPRPHKLPFGFHGQVDNDIHGKFYDVMCPNWNFRRLGYALDEDGE